MKKSNAISVNDVQLIRNEFKKETGNDFFSKEGILHPDYVDWLESKLMGSIFAITELNKKNENRKGNKRNNKISK